MKHLKSIAFLAALMLLLTACGTVTETPPTESETPTESITPSESVTPAVNAPPTPVAVEFEFTRENFPRMDGSTSTAPLAEAVACVLLGEPRADVAELVLFNKTTQSFRNLADGLCDILIVSEPNPSVFDELAVKGYKYEMSPIATDALVFVVNASNPVESLTIKQLQKIYTGEITNWSEVGGEDVEISAFQRNAEAGSQVLMEKLVMDGLTMSEPPTEEVIVGMGELITAVKGFDSSGGAIGYTVFYYAEDMRMAEGLKIISVEGVKPDDDTIRSGDYPFLNPYYAVIGAKEPENSPARIMYEWLLSDEGQNLIKYEGYVSVR